MSIQKKLIVSYMILSFYSSVVAYPVIGMVWSLRSAQNPQENSVVATLYQKIQEVERVLVTKATPTQKDEKAKQERSVLVACIFSGVLR